MLALRLLARDSGGKRHQRSLAHGHGAAVSSRALRSAGQHCGPSSVVALTHGTATLAFGVWEFKVSVDCARLHL
eukprot:8791668-Pyramimonas_sp.AAC.1